MKKWPYKRVISLEGDSSVLLSVHVKSCLVIKLACGVMDLIRGVTSREGDSSILLSVHLKSDLIIGLACDVMGLIRGLAFGGSGLIRGVLLYRLKVFFSKS